MKNLKLILSVVLVSLLLSQTAFAQKLITAKELKAKKGVIIVDTRKASDYAKIHIKGAVNVDKNSLEKSDKGFMKSSTEMAAIFGKNGISRDSEIVLYCKSGMNAGRVYWILTYLGAKNVKILDGQMTAWRAARGPLTKVKPSVKKATFTPTVNKSILASKSYVKSKISSSIIVDSRKAEYYNKGKIGNAVNIPFEKLVTDKHNFKDKASLQALFKKAGVTSNKEVILYCKTGLRASHMYFVLKEILKYPKVKVYDGSYNEWTM
ncbi:MAG: sulfurtransferase [Bacteroidota bacterium]